MITILLSDADLAISPAPQEVLNLLTLTVKRMALDRGRMKTTRTKEAAYVVTNQWPNGTCSIVTHQGFWFKVTELLVRLGYPHVVRDHRTAFPDPRFDLMFGFRFSQEEILRTALSKNTSGLIGAPTRYGKCFGIDTPIMMADGSIKPVQDVNTGDYVMGPDSKPRRVAGCTRGKSKLYRVIPNYKGMQWVCNEEHILHLQRTRESKKYKNILAGTVENISVKEWLGSSNWFKHIRKMRRVCVEFPPADLFTNPYIYGVWLGDGHSGLLSFTNAEPEVWDAVTLWAADNSLIESTGRAREAGKAQTRHWVKNLGTGSTKRGTNTLLRWFAERGKELGIRKEYMTSSKEQRLELLAGILDTDGESNSSTNCGFISKHRKLAEDVAYVCRTLGFGASVKPSIKKAQTGPKRVYWRVKIRGNTDIIPFRVPRKIRVRDNKFNHLTVGFKVTPEGFGDYYGFALEDPEGLFLLGDCTVVHNTTLIKNTCRAYPGVATVVTAPGNDLIKQTFKDLTEALPGREVVLIGGGSRKRYPSDDITVCSIDSLHKVDRERTKLLLIDEPHAAVTDGRLPEIDAFKGARRIGYGATLKGRFDGRDLLIEGLIGPVLAQRTYREAVAEGAICPIAVIMVVIPFKPFSCGDRNRAYRELLFQSPRIADTVRWISDDVIPADWQTLMFIKNEDEAEFFSNRLADDKVPVAMAKLLTTKERADMTESVRTAEVNRVLCSDIYVQGVTFSDLRVLINLAGGGPYTTAIQKPGRLAEIRPDLNKRYGVMIDFLFVADTSQDMDSRNSYKIGAEWSHVVRDSQSRLKEYNSIGYNVFLVSTRKQLTDTWARLQ